MERFIAVLILTVIITTSIFYYFMAVLIWLVTRPFDRRLRLLHLYTCFWGAFYTYIVPAWKVSVEGREKIRRDAAYVIVSNHQSQLDILVLFRLYVHFKWVSKSEIFKIPLIGWNMVLNRYIKLRRGDKGSIAQMMADSEERLAEGSSIFIFPEGSRSPDGNLKPFKMGAFILAKKMKVPILPVVVEGTRHALPKYSVNYHGTHRIRVRVLDEVPYESFADASEEELSRRLWETINTERLRLQEELGQA
ncbi:MAG TPA: 1-acyl-sn-glycerol-3-phosphate acyltransferase [Spirochaetota bacterium]|nr:1-acyl-sn-glycerol-3-phosphate acyltransferase [Spirochaetota bacterium]